MSGWIIGFASKANSPSEGTWRDSRLGGYAIWPSESHPEVPPCPLCNRPRLLFLQAYAPHAAHPERFLVIFACNSAICGRDVASWCAYRGFQRSKKEDKETIIKTTTPIPISISENDNVNDNKEVNWDSSSDESNATSETSLGELETMLNENLNIGATCTSNNAKSKSSVPSTAVENAKNATLVADEKKHVAAEGRCFGANFIEVEYEQEMSSDDDDTTKKDGDDKIERLLKAYEAEERSDTTGTTWGPEDDAEETDAVIANDEFRKVIERAPEQILRYKFGGEPLWPKHPPPIFIEKKCGVCGNAENVFELQILGSVLYFMDAERAIPRKQREAALNFMAVAIYTCINDCEETRHTTNNSNGVDGTRDDYEDLYQYHRVEVVVQPDVW